MRVALLQPEIPQNAGAIFRLCACFDVPCDVVEPTGFVLDDRKLRRSGMDYIDRLTLTRHADFDGFRQSVAPARLVLFTTQGPTPYHRFRYRSDDVLVFGNEGRGAPDIAHRAADARLRIPIRPDLRSLNLAQSVAMGLSEALRQTGGLDRLCQSESGGEGGGDL